MKSLAVILVVAIALVGCSATTTQTGLATTGQALIGVGNTFVTVGQAYNVICLPTVKEPKLTKFCTGFRDFAPKFQKAYPVAVDAWNAARRANDAAKANDAVAVVLGLTADLTALSLQVLGGLQ